MSTNSHLKLYSNLRNCQSILFGLSTYWIAQPDNEVGNHTGIGDGPNKPVSQIWPEAWFGGTEHLYIQMPSLRGLSGIPDKTGYKEL